MVKTKVDDSEAELRELALRRNIELGKFNVKELDRDDFMKKLLQAKQLGMFLRDREMSRRIESGQIIRIVTAIAEDSETRKQYIEVAMPQIAPMLERK